MRFRQFTKAYFLRRIGRGLLRRFFRRFQADLKLAKVQLPDPTLPEAAYYHALARLAMSPQGLPDAMIDAMYAIEELANPDGQERLEERFSGAGAKWSLGPSPTSAEIAVQCWLSDKSLFDRALTEHRIAKLSSFQCYMHPVTRSRATSFVTPTARTLTAIEEDLDQWFAAHNRGKRTARVEHFPLQDEHWFLISHGDTFARVPTAEEGGKTKVRHLRPARQDAVIYSPQRDDIRVRARTKGEKQLYRRTFGARLFGDANYFAHRTAYSLDPLRAPDSDTLRTEDVDGIQRVALVELEWTMDGAAGVVARVQADDLIAVWADPETRCPRPIPAARLVRATFEFRFEGSSKARKVHIRPPNILKLSRQCDAGLVEAWIAKRGFRAPSGKAGL